MKKISVILIYILVLSTCLVAQHITAPVVRAASTYYVATDGDNGAAGTGTDTAWATITYAFSQATAGDTVYVKAGTYSGETITAGNNGSAGNYITFEGVDSNWDTIATPSVLDVFSGTLAFPGIDSSAMPVMDGGGSGRALDFNQCDYIVFKNFYLYDYGDGLYSEKNSQYLTIDNVIGREFSTNYGISIHQSSYITIQNCQIANANMNDIGLLSTSYSTIYNCAAWNLNGGVDSDYGITIAGNWGVAHDNTVTNCYAENFVGDNGSHGIGCKESSDAVYNNTFTDCVAWDYGETLYCAHDEVYNNTFTDCWAMARPGGSTCKGIALRDGAHDNTFVNCIVDGPFGYGSVYINDTGEDGANNPAAQDNSFINCIFRDFNPRAIFFYDTSENPGINNLWTNCVFEVPAGPSQELIQYSSEDNTGNVIQNSIIANVTKLEDDKGSGNSTTFNYNIVWSCGFGTPTGTGNMDIDPLFDDFANDDYHVGASSPAVDAGTADDAPNEDFDGVSRPQGDGIDIGIYEYPFYEGTSTAINVSGRPIADVLYINKLNGAASDGYINGVEF